MTQNQRSMLLMLFGMLGILSVAILLSNYSEMSSTIVGNVLGIIPIVLYGFFIFLGFKTMEEK